MKLARLGELGQETPVLLDGDAAYDLSGLTRDLDGAFFASGGLDRVRAAFQRGELGTVEDFSTLRVGAPVARPSAIVCIGLNYAAHAAESGVEPPKDLVIFMKTPNTVAGPYDTAAIPKNSTKTDWEVELGVVIGTPVSYLESPAESMSYVAGFVLANDLSERTFQLEVSGGQWCKGKCSPGFSPLGPWLVTADEVDHANLGLRSWVNGEPRQDSTTADLIFDVPTIIYELSQYMQLEPGDVVLTGTPQGVALSGRFPYLCPGDVVEVEIDGLGRQRQEFIQA